MVSVRACRLATLVLIRNRRKNCRCGSIFDVGENSGMGEMYSVSESGGVG
jgi:hypothetical protein